MRVGFFYLTIFYSAMEKVYLSIQLLKSTCIFL